VGIMAGRAGGFLVHDMVAVAAVLVETVHAFEAVVGEDAVASVALIAGRYGPSLPLRALGWQKVA
jgi:hypothetical protein